MDTSTTVSLMMSLPFPASSHIIISMTLDISTVTSFSALVIDRNLQRLALGLSDSDLLNRLRFQWRHTADGLRSLQAFLSTQ